MLAAIVATQIQMMVLGLCVDGAKATCTIAGCSKAQKICVGGYWDPCTCIGTQGPVPCNDGNACTVNDVIGTSGQCAGTPVNVSDGDPCTTDTCNPSTGVITHVRAPAGTACNDANTCTSGDVCDANGRCGGTPVAVDDGNPCTFDVCDPATGAITHPPVSSADPTCSSATFYCYDKYGNVTRKAVCVAGTPCNNNCLAAANVQPAPPPPPALPDPCLSPQVFGTAADCALHCSSHCEGIGPANAGVCSDKTCCCQ